MNSPEVVDNSLVAAALEVYGVPKVWSPIALSVCGETELQLLADPDS